MGLYAKHILPRVLDLVMRNSESARIRAEVIPRAQGAVLELGIGSGLNLPFYSASVSRVYGVDPSAELREMARKRAATTTVDVSFFAQTAEDPIPLDDRSIDTIVVTWALCSIPNATEALRQAKRVLKPTGRLLFVEHGLSPDRGVQTWQNRLNPLWGHISGGCNLNRKIDELIDGAGFKITELATAYQPGPRPMTYTYRGVAESTSASADLAGGGAVGRA